VLQDLTERLEGMDPVLSDEDARERRDMQLVCAVLMVAAELRGLRLDYQRGGWGEISEPSPREG
jgi:hypothetical protein